MRKDCHFRTVRQDRTRDFEIARSMLRIASE